MEVKPGYKQTEVGVIPEAWQAKPLGDGISLLSGHHVLAQHCNTEGRGKPYITGPADFPNGVINTTKFTEKPATMCRQGDILITVKGSGAGTIVLADSEYCISRQLMAIRVSDWHTGYLYESLRRNTSLFGAAATGLIPGLSRGDILDKQLASPPLPEQRAIAEALSDVDGLLGGLDRVIAKKRDLKQAAMQQLLSGQTRLPGFTGEWRVTLLGEVADIKTGPFGSALHESDYAQQGTPIITVEHLGKFGVNHVNLPLVCEYDYLRLSSYKLEVGDIVFSRVGSVDRNALIGLDEEGWLFSGRLLRVRPNKEVAFAAFLSYQFHSTAFVCFVRSMAVGQTMACLNTQILKGIPVSLPTIDEQKAIAAALKNIDEELVALELRLGKARMLKEAMMQELLTGRTRLT